VELSIAAKTVESHVSAVLRKLQLTTRHQLTRWASERRLVWRRVRSTGARCGARHGAFPLLRPAIPGGVSAQTSNQTTLP